jgi:serine/threonine protein kinase
MTQPNIVRAYDVVQGRSPAVVLETLSGQTLAHLVATSRDRLSSVDIGFLGLQLCAAVRYLHRHGALHLDLKPSNVVCRDGQAILIDLSIARPPGRVGAGIGTNQYMAPEQARGGMVGAPADVWGIGATLFEASTGRAPFASDAQAERVAPRLDRYRRLPRTLRETIADCMDPDPTERPVLEALVKLLEADLLTRPTDATPLR